MTLEDLFHPSRHRPFSKEIRIHLIKNKFLRKKRTRSGNWAIKIVRVSDGSGCYFCWAQQNASIGPKNFFTSHLNLSCQMRKFLSLTIFMNTLKFLLVANFSLFTFLSFVRMHEKPTTTAKNVKHKSRKQQERKLLTRKTLSKIIIITIILPAFSLHCSLSSNSKMRRNRLWFLMEDND